MRIPHALVIVLCAVLAACAPQPAPLAPNPILLCFTDGLEKCVLDVWLAYGWGGVTLLALVAGGLFLASPLPKIAQERVEAWWRALPWVRGPAPAPADIQRQEETYLQHALADLDPTDPAAKLEAYLRVLRERENPLKPSEDTLYIPLEGGLTQDDLSPRLGLHVGGPPPTTPQTGWAWLKARLRPAPPATSPDQLFREQRVFENLEEALTATDERTGQPYPALALLGEPGAGKSTVLRRLARVGVHHRLADPAARLPLFVSLSAHRDGLPLTFLRLVWKQALGFDGLDEALASGQVWLFADGLNEMPRAQYDRRLAQWRAFLHSDDFAGRGNRALVACREADYGEGLGVPRLVIHRMDAERIQAFLRRRIPDRAQALWQELEADRQHSRAMYTLAQTPFWLVMLARLTGHAGLPRNRAALLDSFIRTWLDYEASRPGGRALTADQRHAFGLALTRLAGHGLAKSQNYTFARAEAERLLSTAQTALSVADLLALARDCHLLDLTPHSVRFQHQLLQEFFAARDLAARFAAGEALHARWQVPWRRWRFVHSRWDPLPPPPRTGWEEALILAAGLLDPAQAEALTRAILRDNPPLAARCALEAGLDLPEPTLNAVRQALLADLRAPRQRIPARLEAGRALARLGDPRLLARRRTGRAPEAELACIEPDWVDLPAGEFQLGTPLWSALRVALAYRYNPQNELPAHRVRLPAYKMARWPVTVAEYRCFMQAEGYANPDWWATPAARRWWAAPLPFEESYAARQIQTLKQNEAALVRQLPDLQRRGEISPEQVQSILQTLRADTATLRAQWERNEAQKRDAHGWAARPWGWDNPDVQVANAPVVGVTWYEANAYAVWLTASLRAGGQLPDGWEIRLPTEAEWERAARWVPAAPQQVGGRGLWPWGDRWQADRANTLEGRVMKPTPVGAYPQGDAPAGLYDMAGNVWEWCADGYDPAAYQKRLRGTMDPEPTPTPEADQRVVRGGAWYNLQDFARCAYRHGSVPDYDYSFLGFRCVCAPSSPSLPSDSLHSDSLNLPPPPP